MTLRTSLLIALVVFLTACAPSPPPTASAPPADPAAVRQAIEAADARFMEAFKKGDKAGLIATYADDAVVMMPNEPAWRGKDGMDKGFGAFLAQMTFQGGAIRTEDVMAAGDLAVETGTYEWTLQPKSGAAIKDKGKYLTAWKKQADGSWKIVRDIINSDLPERK